MRVIILIGIFIILLTAAGQILLKKGADSQSGSQYINRFVISGYMSFLLTVLLGYHLMQMIPLKYFTVIMSCNYIVVMFGAKLFLKEAITKNRIVGTILITFGVFVFLLK